MSPCNAAETEALPPDVVRYLRVERRDLVYLKFILEAYEGMVTMSTAERVGSIVRLVIPAAFVTDITALLAAVAAEITLQETDFTEECNQGA